MLLKDIHRLELTEGRAGRETSYSPRPGRRYPIPQGNRFRVVSIETTAGDKIAHFISRGLFRREEITSFPPLDILGFVGL